MNAMLENKKKIIKKIVINYAIILIILIVMLWMCIEEFKESKIGRKEVEVSKYNTQNVSIQHNYNDTLEGKEDIVSNIIEEKQEANLINTEIATIKKQKDEKTDNNTDNNLNSNDKIISQYKGYNVIAKLNIPCINLETYVLDKYTEEALNVSVTKFWGANPNQVGNFCIIGHNFQNKNMFHNLKKLKIGNRLFILDNNGKTEYEVYDIYKVKPKDVSCLNQDTNGRREVTLITCTNDSQKRIVVKAKEIKLLDNDLQMN